MMRIWRLTTDVWRLSDAYIGPKSRIERPRKTKIGTEVAHVTRDSDTTFMIKRSKVKVTRPLYSLYSPRPLTREAWCTGDRENILGMGNCCYVASARRRARRCAEAPTGGRRGAGHIVSPRAQLLRVYNSTSKSFLCDTSVIKWTGEVID